jgi:hypothetical protein
MNHTKDPSRRALSFAYWAVYSDSRAFRVFLCCLKKRVDIPPLIKDIKQLLFKYIKRIFLPVKKAWILLVVFTYQFQPMR